MNRFCTCGTSMKIVFDKNFDTGVSGPMYRCLGCYKLEDLADNTTFKRSLHRQSDQTTISSVATFDPSLKRTSRVQCIKKSCISNDPQEWGKWTDDGILIGPQVCVVNHTNQDRVNTYICNVCKTTFGPADN
jgi:hypothetical protein